MNNDEKAAQEEAEWILGLREAMPGHLVRLGTRTRTIRRKVVRNHAVPFPEARVYAEGEGPDPYQPNLWIEMPVAPYEETTVFGTVVSRRPL